MKKVRMENGIRNDAETSRIVISFPGEGILDSQYINLTIEKNGESTIPIIGPIRSFLDDLL